MDARKAIPLAKKITRDQTKIMWEGQRGKHVRIELRGTQTINAVLETPGAWTPLGDIRELCLNPGDLVTIIAADGLTVADSAMVTANRGGELWFSKPLRLVQLEPTGLPRNEIAEVVPVGTMFGIRDARSGHVGEQLFTSARAAEIEMNRGRSSRVA
jgi:hypothetical protein